MRFILYLCCFLSGYSLVAQPYAIGRQTITLVDPARSNRSIPSEIFYPALTAGSNAVMANGSFPVIVFGHGFSMNYDAYANFWNELVPQGYILAFPKTEIGPIPFPSHGALAADMNYTITWFISEGNTAVSRYYQKLNGKYAVMGHSMGGGASFFAAAANPNVTVLANFAAAETNPSAISAAASITVPALVFAGSKDCVAGPSGNQTPMYNALASPCKAYVDITNGSHCQFGESNSLCNFGETSSCSGATYITRAAQHAKTFEYLNPFLRFYLKGDCGAYAAYQQLLANPVGAVVQQTCNYQLPSASIFITGRQNLCVGETATLTANAHASYWWTGGSTQQQITVGQGGTYQLIVTDNMGCKDTATQQINQNSIALAVDVQDVSCNGLADGKAWATATGGYGSFTYLWSGGTSISNDTVGNLVPGNYAVLVTDANNCTVSDNFAIAEPLPLNVSTAQVGVTCHNGGDGNIFVQASGGNGGYVYQWNGGLTGQSFNNVTAGEYRLTLTDSKGCSLQDTVVVSQPTPIQVQAIIVDATCGVSNGEAVLVPSGGSAPYIFLWPNGDTSSAVTGLAGGVYSVLVTDSAGCAVSYSLVVTAPGSLDVQVATYPVTCPGDTDGVAVAMVSGGTAPYQYQWPSGAMVAGDSAMGLAVGTYVFTVADADGCIRTDSFRILAPLLMRPPIVSLTGTQLCEGDTTQVEPMDSYYSYQWNTGDTTQTISVTQSGFYNCTVTNGDGCLIEGVGVTINFYEDYLNPEIRLDGDSLYISEGTVTAWFNNGQVVGGATDNYILYPEPGGYMAQVVDSNGCGYLAKAFVVTGQGKPMFKELKVYPNPASQVLQLEGLPAGSRVQLLDILGNAILETTTGGTLEIVVAHLPSQLYLVRVAYGESTYICKVLISR